MASSKEIKRRIQSVSSTQQITSAMKMVSASKLRRVEDEVGKGEDFRQKLASVLRAAADAPDDALKDPLLEVRPLKRIGFVVFSSNKGLAGGYNNHLLNYAYKTLKEREKEGIEVGVIAVGRKALDFFKRRNVSVVASYLEVSDTPTNADSTVVANEILSFFRDGTFDAIDLFYQKFNTVMSQEPISVRLLPVSDPDLIDEGAAFRDDYIFEPDAATILRALLPLYLHTQVHTALTDAKAGEHGARMTAMTAATDNATDLIAELELSYNRARQAAITNEITEIVAGVNALS